MSPRISAIVSAYYAERFLKGRLENLFSQGLDDLQVIVVLQKDSPEQQIVRDFATRNASVYPRLVISETADIPTVYAAWNQGIEVSAGEFITNANSDDLFYDGALLKMSQALEGHPGSAVVYANVDRVVEYGGKPEGRFEWLEGGFDDLLNKGCFIGPMPMWRRSLHKTYGLFDPEMRSAGDYEFWLRIASQGEKFHHLKGFVCGAHLERLDALEHREPVRSIWEQSRAKGLYRIIGKEKQTIKMKGKMT